MIIASGKIPCKQRKCSPESLIIPADKDISTKQEQISGERFPDNLLELCGKCHRCCTCFNIKGLVDPCPLCGTQGSHIPDTG